MEGRHAVVRGLNANKRDVSHMRMGDTFLAGLQSIALLQQIAPRTPMLDRKQQTNGFRMHREFTQSRSKQDGGALLGTAEPDWPARAATARPSMRWRAVPLSGNGPKPKTADTIPEAQQRTEG